MERRCENCIHGKPIATGDNVRFKIGIYGLQTGPDEIQRTCLTLTEAGFHKLEEFTGTTSAKCVKLGSYITRRP